MTITYNKKLIGLIGHAGSGKSTVARLLNYGYEYRWVSFAKPLKDMLEFGLGIPGELFYNPNLKELPSPLLGGRSPRYAMQTLGTEWGRNLMGSNFWVDMAMNSIDPEELTVFDDVRFPEEAEAIRGRGGVLWKIDRSTAEQKLSAHISEAGIDDLPYDFLLSNSGSLETLKETVKTALNLP